MPPRGIVLAHEPDFRLGGLLVSPSACCVRAAGREERLEPRMMEALIVLARAEGRTVTRDALIEACWGGRVVSDDATSRIIAKLRSLARAFDPPPYALETLPKVGFRLITEEQGEAKAPGSGFGRAFAPWGRPAWRWMAVSILAVLATFAGLVAWRLADGEAQQNGRLEVVRFEARGPDPTLTRLSDDLGDGIIRVLTTAGLTVAPHAASPGEGASANDAELRVAGSVARAGDDYAINAQVIDRASGLVLLSIRTERPAAKLAGFADEAATEIAASLSSALEDRRRSGRPLSPTVFGLYLNTCDAAARESDMPRMLESARRLVAAAPDLAIAQAMYAIALARMADESQQQLAQADALRRQARATAEYALRLDPRTPKAYWALALSYPDSASRAIREGYLLRALDVDPSLNIARADYVGLLLDVGRLGAAREVARRVVDARDPRVHSMPHIQSEAALLSAQNGDRADADELLDALERAEPDLARSARFEIAAWWEDPRKGLGQLPLYAKGQDDGTVACLQTYLQGLIARGGAATSGLPSTCAGLQAEGRIRLLAREGDVDGAYALEAADPPQFPSYLFYPEMAAFRGDARFMPLAKRLGLLDYWLKSGQWPDFCAGPARPYDCQSIARQLDPS